MIDLTPLDVRSKRGDFKKLMRGYDPQEVDTFLELAAERLEELTRENIGLRERTETLQQQVTSQADREQAVQEALVTAQELRADMREQAKKEADHVLKEAETEGRRLIAEAEAEARTRARSLERRLEQLEDALQDLERRRVRFLRDFRQLLERELDVVEVEEGRAPLEERTIDLELGARRGSAPDLAKTDAAGAASAAQPDAASTPAQASASPESSPTPEPNRAPEPAGSAKPAGTSAISPGSAGPSSAPAPTVEPVEVRATPVSKSESVPQSEPVPIDSLEPPPADASVEELQAAYEAARRGETSADAPGPDEPRTEQDNLLLYLDSEEEV